MPQNSYHRRSEFAVGPGLGKIGWHYFHADPEFTLEVPEGELLIEATQGFELYPVAKKVVVSASEAVPLLLELRRMVDFPATGSHNGTNHVHMNYGEPFQITPENMVAMVDAEEVGVITSLVANEGLRVLDHQFFTGGLHPLSNEKHLLYFNQEICSDFYGHILLINVREHLFSPYATGYEGSAIESLYPSNSDFIKMANEEDILCAYVYPFFGDTDPLESNLGLAKAYPVDLALGGLG